MSCVSSKHTYLVISNPDYNNSIKSMINDCCSVTSLGIVTWFIIYNQCVYNFHMLYDKRKCLMLFFTQVLWSVSLPGWCWIELQSKLYQADPGQIMYHLPLWAVEKVVLLSLVKCFGIDWTVSLEGELLLVMSQFMCSYLLRLVGSVANGIPQKCTCLVFCLFWL